MTASMCRAPGAGRVLLEDCTRERQRLIFSFLVDGRRFTKIYGYHDTDLLDLEARFGADLLWRIYFHIMALEALPLAGFRPGVLDLQSFGRFWTPGFEALWRTIFRKAGAQWRYENDLPDYDGPTFARVGSASGLAPVVMPQGDVEALAFCGGGKDSLVALKLLEQGDVTFASYQYSLSSYGPAAEQQRLTNQVLDLTAATRRHSVEVEESPSAADFRAILREYGVHSGICAETPISVFGALPVALAHGYRYVVLGHERSADSGNLLWRRTGETVNHQWGKSSEAESLLNSYIREELISNLTYCSVLKPVYDVVIFNLLRGYHGAATYTHSCNIKKPWCGECAKCAYVGLNFMAYLPLESASAVFWEMLDSPKNEATYRQMLGLDSHKPFECIGEIDEARLALEICCRKGLGGRAARIYQREARPIDAPAALDRYLKVDSSALPPAIGSRVVPLLRQGAREARDYIGRFIG